MQTVTQQTPTRTPQCVIDLKAKICADDGAMTAEAREARFARLEKESQRHGAFARIW